MRTAKVVVIGSSGVGKTSLRNQYISGRFTTGYRATIGADFITKTVPHWKNSEENITLQIWDTAGQERFSSLSSAFFRGADAVLLIYDVNRPETLEALRKWWNDFKDHVPLADEEVDGFCVVFVGNKIDLQQGRGVDNVNGSGSGNGQTPVGGSSRAGIKGNSSISRGDAVKFMEELIPTPPLIDEPSQNSLPPEGVEDTNHVDGGQDNTLLSPPGIERSPSIDISPVKSRHSLSHSRTRSRNGIGTVGTMMTTTTTLSMYHTPSSSVYDSDDFESARSSPVPPSTPAYSSAFSSRQSSLARGQARSPSPIRRKRSTSSNLTASSDAMTITPALVVKTNELATIYSDLPRPVPEGVESLAEQSQEDSIAELEPPDRGPRLFLTSARTGEGVEETFSYVAKRVVSRWEWEELVRRNTADLDGLDDDDGTIGAGRRRRGTVNLGFSGDTRAWGKGECCRS